MASLCIARGIHLNRRAGDVARSCARIQSCIPDDSAFRAANCIFLRSFPVRVIINGINCNIVVNFIVHFSCIVHSST